MKYLIAIMVALLSITSAQGYTSHRYETLPSQNVAYGQSFTVNVPSIYTSKGSYEGIYKVSLNGQDYTNGKDLEYQYSSVKFTKLLPGKNTLAVKILDITYPREPLPPGGPNPRSVDISLVKAVNSAPSGRQQHVTITTFTQTVFVYKTTPPIVSLISSKTVDLYPSVKTTVQFSASGKDSKKLKNLAIYKGSTKVKTCTTSGSSLSCSYPFATTTLGSYKFTAIATDEFGIRSKNSPTATIVVKEKNLAPTVSITANKTVVNSGETVTFTLTAKDDNKVSDNHIKEFKFCIGSSCQLVSKYNKGCATKGKTLSCTISRKVSSTTTFAVQAIDVDYSTKKSLKVVLNDKPSVSIKTSLPSPFLNEKYTITATANDGNKLKKYQVCRFPNGTPPSTPQACSSASLLRNCSLTTSSCVLTNLSTAKAGRAYYYVYAEDQYGAKSSSYVSVNALAPMGMVISSTSNPIEQNAKLTLTVKVSALSSRTTKLKSLQLFVNNKATSATTSPSLSSAKVLSRSGTTFTVTWTPKTAGDINVHLLAKDTLGNALKSSVMPLHVALPKPQAPTVRPITTQSGGRYTVSIVPSTYAQSYTVYENGRKFGEYSHTKISVQKGFKEHNKRFTYCASASNVHLKSGQKQTSSVGSGAQCATIQVNNPDPTPDSPIMTGQSLTKTNDYEIWWRKNNDDATVYYQLLQWPGTPADLSKVTPTLIYQGSNNFSAVKQLKQGIYSYQVNACSKDDVCSPGQQLTFNHIPVLLQKVRTNGCYNRCIILEGIGFDPDITHLSVRVRNTGEVFTYSLDSDELDLPNEHMLLLQANSRTLEGLRNGGLYIEVTNGVDGAQPAAMTLDETGANGGFDMVHHAPVVSDSGNIYFGHKKDIYALNSYGVQLWKARTRGEVTARPLLRYYQGQDEIIVGSHDKSVYSLDAQGQENWVTKTRGPILAAAQIDQNANIYVGSMDKALYSLDAKSGLVQWLYQFPYGVTQQPVVSGNNSIYVTTEDGQVHELDRGLITLNALKFSELGQSVVKSLLEKEPNGWEPSQQNSYALNIAKMFYAVLQRSPSKEELTLFTFAYELGVPPIELVSALLNSKEGLESLPPSDSPNTFINTIYDVLFDSLTVTIDGRQKSYWSIELAYGMTRAAIILELIDHSERFNVVANNTLFYFYDFCLLSKGCEYTADSDDDGLTDEVEIILGTNPADPRDGFNGKPVLSYEALGNGSYGFSFNAAFDTSFFELSQEINDQSARIVASTDEHEFEMGLINGQHVFLLKGCIEIELRSGQVETQCSEYSDPASILVSNSVYDPVIGATLNEKIAQKNVLSQSDAEISATFATTPAQFKVSEQGSATVSVPIELPAGITGVKPSVSLEYNSQTPETSIAVGWSINAASSVSRCRQTKAQDGYFEAITFSEHDRFCLDGQRLIKINDRKEGAVGAEYKLELDNQQRITIEKGARIGQIMFVVSAKDGSKSYFGGTSESQLALAGNRVISWYLRKVEDHLGNEESAINYIYADSSNITGQLFGDYEKVLTEINYSGNKVVFNYNSSPTLTRYSMLAGEAMTQRAKLNGIEVYNHLGEALFNYELQFEQSINGLRQLTQVSQCANTICKKPVVLTYHPYNDSLNFDVYKYAYRASGSTLSAYSVTDITADGIAEQISLTKVRGKSYRLCIAASEISSQNQACISIERHNSDEVVQMMTVDSNGDGKQAIWVQLGSKYKTASTAYWTEFVYSQAQGTLTETPLPLEGGDSYMSDLRMGDLNGDGYADIIHKKGQKGEKLYARYWRPATQTYSPINKLGRFGPTFENNLTSGQWDLVEDRAPWHMVDLNFDGLADILTLACSSSGCDGVDEVDSIKAFINKSNGSELTSKTLYYGKAKHLQPLDVNQDGFIDLLFFNKDSEQWQVLLNLGNNEFSEDVIFSLAGMDEDLMPLMADVNRDGLLELIFKGKYDSKWTAYQWHPDRQTLVLNNSFTFSTKELDPIDGDFAFFADYDANGVPDLLYKNGNRVFVKFNLHDTFHQGLLNTLTQGLGADTQVEYGVMLDPTVYTPDEASSAKDVALFEQQRGLRSNTIVNSMPLVKKVTTDTPSTGTAHLTSSVEYQYAAARAQFGGRGWLGFRKLTTKYKKYGKTFETSTYYHQAFPLTGRPERTQTYIKWNSSNITLKNASANQYDILSETSNRLTHYQVNLVNSKECSANINSDFSADGFACTESFFDYDTYANLLNSETRRYHVQNINGLFAGYAAPTPLSSVVTENTYGSSDYEKQYGRLSFTKVVTSRPDTADIIRESAFTYYPSQHQNKGMLKDEIIMPNGDCDSYLKTTHRYDELGNEITTIRKGADNCSEVPARVTSLTYDDQGRYLSATSNDLYTEQQVLARNALGLPTKVSDANGTVTDIQYDVFGAQLASYNATGAQQSQYYVDCEFSSYFCATQLNRTVNGELVEKQYIDYLGRTFRTLKISALGEWLTTEASYDIYGRVIRVREPAKRYSTYRYDELDRPISISDPNSGVDTLYDYQAYTHTATLKGNVPGGIQYKITERNALGEVVAVEDSLGNTLSYNYDAVGNLLQVYSSADEQVITQTAYDALGRKISTDDKNSGKWRYSYNAFSQLVSQTDARGVTTYNVYDVLGRKIEQRVDGEQTAYWHYGEAAKAHQLLQETQGNEWQRYHYYDNFGRPRATLTSLESTLNCSEYVAFNTRSNDLRYTDERLAKPLTSRCVIQQRDYDQYGRLVQQFDDYRRDEAGQYTEARGTRLTYQYGQVVQRAEARDINTQADIYYQVDSLNDQGQVTAYHKGAQQISLSYDAAGMLTGINTQDSYIQTDTYAFDGIGNLTERQLTMLEHQSFGYDALNRITQVNGEQQFSYAENGNLINKQGWQQDYHTTQASPLHALTHRSKGDILETFGYDKNGNQIWGKQNGQAWRAIEYSGRNKATRIEENGEVVTFKYDANNQRYKRTDKENTIYYVGALELTVNHTLNDHFIRRYIGNDALQTYYETGNSTLKWLFTDHQGSTVAITNDRFELLKRFKYDVFGAQSEIAPTEVEANLYYATHISLDAFNYISSNTRSYTGHEPIELGGQARIIHMNGRIYDSAAGRFMQADPHVQAPHNSQNYNRYSYVLNNPLSYTDPSGYFFSKLWKKVKQFASVIVGAALIYFTGGAASWFVSSWYGAATAGAIAGAAGAAANGGNIFKGALTGALSAAAFYGVGSAFQGIDTSFGSTGYFGKVAAHGITGGAMSVLNGGKFGHGFAAAGFTQALAKSIDSVSKGKSFSIKRITAAAVVGGTISRLSGGKFANGAVTGAFSRMFNDELHASYVKKNLIAFRDKILSLNHKSEMGRVEIATAADMLSGGDVDTAMFNRISSNAKFASLIKMQMVTDVNKMLASEMIPLLLGSADPTGGLAQSGSYSEALQDIPVPRVGSLVSGAAFNGYATGLQIKTMWDIQAVGATFSQDPTFFNHYFSEWRSWRIETSYGRD